MPLKLDLRDYYGLQTMLRMKASRIVISSNINVVIEYVIYCKLKLNIDF